MMTSESELHGIAADAYEHSEQSEETNGMPRKRIDRTRQQIRSSSSRGGMVREDKLLPY